MPFWLDRPDDERAQLAGQIAIDLGAPGHGEAFAELGFGSLVGTRPAVASWRLSPDRR